MRDSNRRRFRLTGWFAVVFLGGLVAATPLTAQIMALPYPEPSTNAAAHYSRAMLLLSTIPLEERELLNRPIWESFADSTKEEIATAVADIVQQGRHAIRAAIHGTHQRVCDFGIDYADYGHGGLIPHAPLMLQLARLMTLTGIHAQIVGQQEQAAVMFFEVLRMGHHLASQPTLIESLVGIEILENAYFSLAFWGARCDNPQLVNEAFARLELSADMEVLAARTLAYEAAIVDHQVDRVVASFPDGPWAEKLLESMGEFAVGSEEEMEAAAKKVAVERGIPASVFESKEAFAKFAEQFRQVHKDYFSEAATCMSKSGMQRIECAEDVYAKYQPKFEALGDPDFLDIRAVSRYFAAHEAELAMARVAMAVAADRTKEGFPASLADVSDRFADAVPVSPYDGSPLQYELLNDGKDFLLAVPEAKTDQVVLPRVEFSTVRQTAETAAPSPAR